MPRFNLDNLNIHELAVEEPEKQAELLFDPEKDVLPEEWKMFEKMAKDMANLNSAETTARVVAYLRVLGHPVEIDPYASNTVWPKIIKSIKFDTSFYGGAIGFAFLKLAGHRIFDFDKKRILKSYKEVCTYGEVNSVLAFSAWLKILDIEAEIPEKFTGDIAQIINNEATDEATLAIAKILGYDVKLSAKQIKRANGTIANYRDDYEKNDMRLLHLYYNLAVLAAEDVEITKNGLEIKMPEQKEPLHLRAPVIPESKQF
ncbi:MAG: hypothetical protein A2561_03060 [Candidatus Staskawiczbacteria bacterium RIFOXYD1_FULL_32_13]|uniref:Uncharacterized protein n=1 Tax=Candidatus Staskawiczbacteria bacterium RIFOXYD1_FULL_32_13 TaxID=1802234 RepID=A0A1G2JMG7_9BACT|nr:MAG: hypothetical protein UR22_C0001G0012 [Parcubacteria group bacterium GW2011_GWC2_32_10]OGZ81025.1 MAG: hypothetical protein A2256_04210 [Candidatus Staskawiczbacteria bacterium RIFOXYA2_FULL_32_7]OGZ87651.1 MAG: hypothetical protein A2561_03060 [Candidatus Staskawiczbacteria bacterium RIFOXYD1_FULL_32_13]